MTCCVVEKSSVLDLTEVIISICLGTVNIEKRVKLLVNLAMDRDGREGVNLNDKKFFCGNLFLF